jgi:very-short-patch-repair endonuclease
MNCTNCGRTASLVNGRCPACADSKPVSLLPPPELKRQETKPAKRAKKPRQPSSLESAFQTLAKLAALPPYQTEYEFHPTRKWRFDVCFVNEKVAVEFEGAVFKKQGGHKSISGIVRDMAKYNAASLMGFKVLRYHAKDIEDRPLQMIEEVKQALGLPF